MTEHNDGGSAFPRPLPNLSASPDEAMRIINNHKGMSMRDWFAGMAVQGFAANPNHVSVDFNPAWEGYDGGVPEEFQQTAREAYLLADAMLAEREKQS